MLFNTLTIFHIYPWHTCLHNDIMLGIHNVLKNSNNFHVINIWWLKGWFYFILSNFPSNNQQIEYHQIFCIAFVDIFDITTCGEISTNVKILNWYLKIGETIVFQSSMDFISLLDETSWHKVSRYIAHLFIPLVLPFKAMTNLIMHT